MGFITCLEMVKSCDMNLLSARRYFELLLPYRTSRLFCSRFRIVTSLSPLTAVSSAVLHLLARTRKFSRDFHQENDSTSLAGRSLRRFCCHVLEAPPPHNNFLTCSFFLSRHVCHARSKGDIPQLKTLASRIYCARPTC